MSYYMVIQVKRNSTNYYYVSFVYLYLENNVNVAHVADPFDFYYLLYGGLDSNRIANRSIVQCLSFTLFFLLCFHKHFEYLRVDLNDHIKLHKR